MPIQRLDEQLINKIAAGEVIERPASVVKELVENSLDAGSSRIQIHLEQSGLALIQVTDNGRGIARAEIPLAFERHATSKISTEKELFRIRTLGFRGEALPSVASVSRVKVETRTEEELEGTSIEIEGGKLLPPVPVACNRGTKISVRDLFFNTPVRLKYIKSLQTELGHCVDVVQKLSLAHPKVAFLLQQNGKPLFQSPGDGVLLHAFSSIYGKETAKQMLPCRHFYRDHTVEGLLGLPAVSRAGRQHGLFFLNGRPVRHFGLLNAVAEAYGHRLPLHRYPVFALMLHLDPSLVDVNVHPTKLEVRFSEEEDARQAVREAVEKALETATPIPAFGSGGARRSQPVFIERETYKQQTLSDSPDRSDSEQEVVRHPLPGLHQTQSNPAFVKEQVKEIYQAQPARAPIQTDVMPENRKRPKLGLVPVAQTLGMYVLAENPDGLYIIDQHAAHERILFERFRRQYTEKKVGPLPMLVPITRELTPTEKITFEKIQGQLQAAGFEIEPFGETAILIRAVPDIWSGQHPETLAMEFLDEWLQNTPSGPAVIDKLEDMIIQKACKAAIKANQWLSTPEMEALCKGLDELEDPFHCPHGRPILLHFSHYELEKQFKRVM